MIRHTFVLVSLCLFATLVRADLPLADQTRALELIVVSPTASDATKAIAKELADYLDRVTGAKFGIQTGDGSRGIVLGTLAEFPNCGAGQGARNPQYLRRHRIVRDSHRAETLAAPRRDGAGHSSRGLSLPRTPRLPLVLSGSGVGGRARSQDTECGP